MEELLRRLQGQVIRGGIEDVLVWRFSKGGAPLQLNPFTPPMQVAS